MSRNKKKEKSKAVKQSHKKKINIVKKQVKKPVSKKVKMLSAYSSIGSLVSCVVRQVNLRSLSVSFASSSFFKDFFQ